MKIDKSTKIVFILFIGISIIIFTVGIICLAANLNKKKNCTEQVTATITEVVKSSGYKHKRHTTRKTYRHIFSYEYNNKKYEIKYGRGYKDKDTFVKGQKYTIYVNPKLPSQFIVEGHENDIDALAIAAPITGASMAILFSTIYIILKRKTKEDN